MADKAIDAFRGPYRFLSNFAMPAEVMFEGLTYPSVEHAFQAAKTLSETSRSYVSKLPTAASAKVIGRTLTLRPDWEDIKLDVMLKLLREKFKPASDYAPLLLATGYAELVESNYWHDVFWGVCRCPQHNAGENHLGKLLMQVRAELRVGAP